MKYSLLDLTGESAGSDAFYRCIVTLR